MDWSRVCGPWDGGDAVRALRNFRTAVPLFKPKTKMISFRISEEEFWALRQICTRKGSVSLSNLVRTAVQELISNRTGRNPAAIGIVIEKRSMQIEAMDREMAHVANVPRPPSW